MDFIKGIDVSQHNGIIDWQAVRRSGTGFAMLRAGYGRHTDEQFKRNAAECNRTGLPCGVYWFSYALNAEQAAEEASACLEAIRPYEIQYPVGFDLEYDSVQYARRQGVRIGMKQASEMARTFLRAIQNAGYHAMNYANPDFLRRYFDKRVQTEFPVWLAQWPSGVPKLEQPPRRCTIWQYSERGRVAGITGPVDLDVSYGDYEKEKETDEMTGEQIYNALNAYLDTVQTPEWAKEELDRAIERGITDGKHPNRLIPRYQAAIMALRAGERSEPEDGKITLQ